MDDMNAMTVMTAIATARNEIERQKRKLDGWGNSRQSHVTSTM